MRVALPQRWSARLGRTDRWLLVMRRPAVVVVLLGVAASAWIAEGWHATVTRPRDERLDRTAASRTATISAVLAHYEDGLLANDFLEAALRSTQSTTGLELYDTAVLLPDCGLEDAMVIADRLLTAQPDGPVPSGSPPGTAPRPTSRWSRAPTRPSTRPRKAAATAGAPARHPPPAGSSRPRCASPRRGASRTAPRHACPPGLDSPASGGAWSTVRGADGRTHMADAQDILDRMEKIFGALRDGTATNMNSLANIRTHVVALEAEVKELRTEVKALRDAHPHA
jgi:hypothetical protein